MSPVPCREASPPPRPPRDIVAPDGLDLRIDFRTRRARVVNALLLAGLIAVSCGLWLFSLLWLYSVRHAVPGLF